MNVTAIEGFTYSQSEGNILDGTSNREFLATNRSWKEINHSFDRVPTLCIREMLKSSEYDTPIAVLDIGAGIDRRASEDLQVDRKVGKHLNVCGIDAIMRAGPYKAEQVTGNFLDMPFTDASYEVAYSRQGIAMAGMSMPNVLSKALFELERILKPDGLAFVDINPSQPEHSAGFKAYERAADTSLFLGRMGTFGKLRDILVGQGHYHSKQSLPRFLILAKGLGSSLIGSLAEQGQDIEAI